MKPLYLTFLALLTLTLLSCGGEKQQPSIAQPAPEPEKIVEDNTLFISTFTDLPNEIDGCSCLFSSDSVSYANNTYIFANDFAKVSFMQINGKLTKFEQISFIKNDSLSTTASYKSDGGVEIDIETKRGKEMGEESVEETGTITVKQDDGQTITKSIYGACGC